MLHYLSSDVSALIGFAHLKPSCGMRKSEFSGIAWFYANHRMFGESGRMIAKRLKERRITEWYVRLVSLCFIFKWPEHDE